MTQLLGGCGTGGHSRLGKGGKIGHRPASIGLHIYRCSPAAGTNWLWFPASASSSAPGRPLILPQQLLLAELLQGLNEMRSESMLFEQVDDNWACHEPIGGGDRARARVGGNVNSLLARSASAKLWPPVQRSRWEQPAERIPVEIGSLAKFPRVAIGSAVIRAKEATPALPMNWCRWQWMTASACRSSCRSSRSRLNEMRLLTVGGLSRTAAQFSDQGCRCASVKTGEYRRVLSENVPACKFCSRPKPSQTMGLRVKKMRPSTRRTQRKAVRFVTALPEGGFT